MCVLLSFLLDKWMEGGDVIITCFTFAHSRKFGCCWLPTDNADISTQTLQATCYPTHNPNQTVKAIFSMMDPRTLSSTCTGTWQCLPKGITTTTVQIIATKVQHEPPYARERVGSRIWTCLSFLPEVESIERSGKYSSRFMKSFTYDHRKMNIGLPVRSALHKHLTGGSVVRWVTTGESPLLYVFESYFCSRHRFVRTTRWERWKNGVLLVFSVMWVAL